MLRSKKALRCHGVEQHLDFVYTATACIELPSLALKGNLAPGGVMDVSVDIECFGICLYELGGPTTTPLRSTMGMNRT